MKQTDYLILIVSIIIGAILLVVYPQSYIEIFGFITGLLCVAYIVRENIWNFPIGILNNVFFIILFYQSALYADMGLQVIYIGLALIGAYAWMYGGTNKSILQVSRITSEDVVVIIGVVIASTLLLNVYLISVNDSFPLLDALTTCLSLAAQWLLNFKKLENWIIWMIADILYIWLYIQKNLNLTAVLYIVFFALCVMGFVQWYKSYKGECNENT